MSGLRESRVKPWHIAGLLTLAIALLQVAWIFSVRPYGQMDEVVHSYRAASVAQGHLVDRQDGSAEAGDLIAVPASIVAAAHHRCAQLTYMKSTNCVATSAPDGAGDVMVASTAARYNPLYYLSVGWASRLAPHDGVLSNELMRGATALWCDVLFFVTALVTIRHSRSRVGMLGLAVVVMPVALCASVSVAPNGIQMFAGLGMWAALSPLLAQPDLSPRSRGRLVLLTAVMAALVVVSHTTGPLWVLLTGLVAIGTLGRRGLGALWRTNRSSVLATMALVGAATGAMVTWTLLVKANDFTAATHDFGAPPLADYLSQPLAWTIQSVGAVPWRNLLLPIWVYALAIGEFVLVMALALASATRGLRIALLAIGVGALASSFVLNFAAYSHIGNAWQGRYSLALGYGLPLLGAAVLDRSKDRTPRWTLGAVMAATVIVNATAVFDVRYAMEGRVWTSGDGIAPMATAGMVALVAGAAALILGATRAAHRYFVDDTQRSSAASAEPSSMAAPARSMPAAIRSSSEPLPAS